MFKYTRLLNKLKNESYEIEYENENISEKDETILYVKLNEKQDAISKFSAGEDVTITPELSEYLQQDKEYFKLDKPINIRINCEKELSGEDKDDIKREDNLNVIIEETDRLNLLVNDIIELTKINNDLQNLNITEFDLVE